MEEKPEFEVVRKEPTYHKFEDAYGRLRKSEQDLLEKTHIMKPNYIAEKCDEYGLVPSEQYKTKYDNGPFNEIQTNMKKEFPADKKEGDIKYTSLTDKQAAQVYPSSEYAIRYKAIADNIAGADKKNHPNASQTNKSYKASKEWRWFDTGARIAEGLSSWYGPHPLRTNDKTSLLFTNPEPKLRIWQTSHLENTVNTPLSNYYKYVNDDDHWVNPNVVNLDDNKPKGEK